MSTDKQTLKKLVATLAKAENLKKKLGIDRDKLREYIDEIEGILETADSAFDAFDPGLRSMVESAEELSKYL